MHRKICEKMLSKTGVYRSQHRILMYISKNKNTSQKQIAEAMEVSTPTIAVSIKKLEAAGYVHKITNKEDNRFNKIVLTAKGEEVIKLSKKIFDDIEKNMFNNFSNDEIKTLNSYLIRMYQNLLELYNKD